MPRAKKVKRAELLLADFDESTSMQCARIAESLDYAFQRVHEQHSVATILRREEVSVVLLDTATISEYLELTKQITKKSARINVFILDEHPTIPRAVEAIKAGATDYLEKPLAEDVLEKTILEALRRYRNFEASVLPLEQLEKSAIEDALAQANGNKIEAARLLSIGKTTLYRKLRQYSGESSQTLVKS
jgi:DNA-binding NtrC family response regulator